MLRPFTLLALTLATGTTAIVVAANQLPTVRARDARSHIGKQVVVHDSVAEVVSEKQSGFTYINFSAPFPQQSLTAVLPDSVEKHVGAARLLGQWIRVTGTVRYGRDSAPEILCLSPSQIAPGVATEVPPDVRPAPVAPSRLNCCRICTTGKACGNSCIARSQTCRQPPGCACDG
jgi:hypothetical protein